jgi:hypothetical protein
MNILITYNANLERTCNVFEVYVMLQQTRRRSSNSPIKQWRDIQARYSSSKNEIFPKSIFVPYLAYCEDAVKSNNPIKLVENTSSLIRLANRVLQVAKQELENSEDPNFMALLNNTTQDLHAGKRLPLSLIIL